jgi:hypothetical protein
MCVNKAIKSFKKNLLCHSARLRTQDMELTGLTELQTGEKCFIWFHTQHVTIHNWKVHGVLVPHVMN